MSGPQSSEQAVFTHWIKHLSLLASESGTHTGEPNIMRLGGQTTLTKPIASLTVEQAAVSRAFQIGVLRKHTPMLAGKDLMPGGHIIR